MSIQNAKLRARKLIFASEGFIAHMYLDTVSQVTVGYGTMLPNAAATIGIQMFDRVKKTPATAQQKSDEWNALRKQSPAGAKINNAATSYAAKTTLVLTEAEGMRLFDLKLDGFIVMLRANYKGFDTFPEDAQVAMLDMAYNLGAKIYTVFKSFSKAVNDPQGPDWTLAAKESNRPQLSATRNAEVRDLFLSAAKA